MTVLRDDRRVDSEEAEDRGEWTRPAVQRLAAGNAEDGRGPLADALNFS